MLFIAACIAAARVWVLIDNMRILCSLAGVVPRSRIPLLRSDQQLHGILRGQLNRLHSACRCLHLVWN